MRETRDRISRVVTEIEEYKVRISEEEAELEEIDKHNSIQEVPCVQKVSEVAVKGKKTRAMSYGRTLG